MRQFPYLQLLSLLCGSFIWLKSHVKAYSNKSFCTTLKNKSRPGLTKGLKSSVMALPQSSEHPAFDYLHIYSHRFHINYLRIWSKVLGHANSQCLVQHAVFRCDTGSAPGLERKIVFQREKVKNKSRTQHGAKSYNLNLNYLTKKKTSKLRQISSRSSSDTKEDTHKTFLYKNKSLMVNPILRSPKSQRKALFKKILTKDIWILTSWVSRVSHLHQCSEALTTI